VQQGFVANLDHPGGNITGLSAIGASICSQWLKLLKEISPNLRHFAVIYNPETTTGSWLPLVKSVAPGFGLEVNEAAVNNDNEIDGVLGALKTSSDAGVIVLPGFFTMVHRQRIIDFAGRYRLPAVYWESRFVNDGGLMSYTFSVDPLERQAVAYVDRILKGEMAGDLPVQEATKFELVINLKTAKTLGLTVPPSLLARADKVIE
jgi:putative ABC transport system substrate-binding protein